MTQAHVEPPVAPPASEELVRARAAELVRLAEVHGISELAFASPGRLRGHISPSADPFAPFTFQIEASRLLGAEVELLSDGALANTNVSPDLRVASPL